MPKSAFLSTVCSKSGLGLLRCAASRTDRPRGRRPLGVCPPLVIESYDIDEIGQRLERALDDVARDLNEGMLR